MKTEPIPTVLAIHGVPRSGTTWLGEVFNSHEQVAYRYQPFFSYAFKNRLDRTSSSESVRRFFSDLVMTEDDFVLQRGKSCLSKWKPEFTKTRAKVLAYKEVRYHYLLPWLLATDISIVGVGIIRHPCGVINSWYQAPREFDARWDLLEEWHDAPKKNAGRAEEYFGYRKWKEVALMFHRLSREFPDNFHIVGYEDLVRDPVRTIEPVITHLGLDITSQMARYINASQSWDDADPYGTFRSDGLDRANGWRYELDKRIQQAIFRDLEGNELSVYLG